MSIAWANIDVDALRMEFWDGTYWIGRPRPEGSRDIG
jgi:hypothetical protein